MKRFRWPVSTFNGRGAFYAYNVQIPFEYFDPPRGNPGDGARGYQLMPNPKDLLWYKATRSKLTKYLLNETDVNVSFQQST